MCVGRMASSIAALLMLMVAVPLQAKPELNRPAEDFTFTAFGGEKLKLADFRGRVLLINIWATWCGPCRTELPLLESYYRAARQYGLGVIAVTTEDSVPPRLLKPLQEKLTIPMARGFKGKYQPIDRAVPSNYVIDRAGVLRYAKAGAFDLDELNAVLIPLLREAAPPEPAPVSAEADPR